MCFGVGQIGSGADVLDPWAGWMWRQVSAEAGRMNCCGLQVPRTDRTLRGRIKVSVYPLCLRLCGDQEKSLKGRLLAVGLRGRMSDEW